MIVAEGISYDDVLIIPRYSDIASRKNVDMTVQIGRHTKLTLPVIAANMPDLVGYQMCVTMARHGGIACLPRFMSIEDNVALASKLIEDDVPFWASVGSFGNDQETNRLDRLVKAGVNTIVIDVAHGNSDLPTQMYIYGAAMYPDVDFVLGNVIETPFANNNPILKVGIGPGSVCTTRIKTGCGYPQLSAVMNTSHKSFRMTPLNTVIADGGLKTPGDCVKALVGGATAVMIGGMLAGSDACADPTHYAGSASTYAYKAQNRQGEYKTAEGAEFATKGINSTDDVLRDIAGGIRSGMSYVGARTIQELWKRGSFVKVTAATQKENGAHFDNR